VDDKKESGRKPTTKDAVLQKMIEEKIPITLENYVELAYLGSKCVEDLGPEELAELPEIFDVWGDGEIVH
jgi:hypothetical protein